MSLCVRILSEPTKHYYEDVVLAPVVESCRMLDHKKKKKTGTNLPEFHSPTLGSAEGTPSLRKPAHPPNATGKLSALEMQPGNWQVPTPTHVEDGKGEFFFFFLVQIRVVFLPRPCIRKYKS